MENLSSDFKNENSQQFTNQSTKEENPTLQDNLIEKNEEIFELNFEGHVGVSGIEIRQK